MSDTVQLEAPRLASVKARFTDQESLTDAMSLLNYKLKAVIVPDNWTTAALTFRGSDSQDGPWHDVYDTTGAELTVPSAGLVAGRYVIMPVTLQDLFAGLGFFKVRSGTTASPVVQVGTKDVILIGSASTK